MTLTDLATYISIMLALAVIPGPSMILAFTEGALLGVARTIPTAIGNMTAALLQAGIALIMINTVASISREVQIGIQLIGSIFIAYLGWSILRSGSAKEVVVDAAYSMRTTAKRFINGFSISAFNPKSIFFFAALFPQLVDIKNGYTLIDYLSFFLPIVFVGFGVFLTFSFVGKVAQGAFGGSVIFQNLAIIMGSFLLLFSAFALLNTYNLIVTHS